MRKKREKNCWGIEMVTPADPFEKGTTRKYKITEEEAERFFKKVENFIRRTRNGTR